MSLVSLASFCQSRAELTPLKKSSIHPWCTSWPNTKVHKWWVSDIFPDMHPIFVDHDWQDRAFKWDNNCGGGGGRNLGDFSNERAHN